MTKGFSGSLGIAFLLQVIAGAVEGLLGHLAGDAEGAQVDQHEVVVGAAGHDAEAFGREGFGEGVGVLHDLVRVVLELGLLRLL